MIHAAMIAALALCQNAPSGRADEREPADPPPTKAAAVQPLGPGSIAPPISVDAWVKGEPVTKYEPGKVYVVEFWATWCGPCLKSMPHMTALQQQHPNVVVIGVAGLENPVAAKPDLKTDAPATDPRLENLRQFVKGRDATIGYRIAFDGDGSMGTSWMRAAKQRSIPWACIVGADGKIAWMGHPDLIDQPLMAVARSSNQKPAGGSPTTLPPPNQPPARPPVKK